MCSAVDNFTGEKVAIKKITNVFEHVSDATRIVREIKLLRLLKHPGKAPNGAGVRATATQRRRAGAAVQVAWAWTATARLSYCTRITPRGRAPLVGTRLLHPGLGVPCPHGRPAPCGAVCKVPNRNGALVSCWQRADIVDIKHIMLPPSPKDFKDIYVVFELLETDLHQVGLTCSRLWCAMQMVGLTCTWLRCKMLIASSCSA